LGEDIPFYIRIPESTPPNSCPPKCRYVPTIGSWPDPRPPDFAFSQAGIKYELMGQVYVQSKTCVPLYSLSLCSHARVLFSFRIVTSFEATSQPSSLPLLPSLSTSMSSTPLGLSSSSMKHVISPRMPLSLPLIDPKTVMVPVIASQCMPQSTLTEKIRSFYEATNLHSRKQPFIGEQKVPLNLTMHSGQVHRSELAVTIPQTYTTTTLTYARHIDITYILVVKALMGTGKPIDNGASCDSVKLTPVSTHLSSPPIQALTRGPLRYVLTEAVRYVTPFLFHPKE
jgi:hypothetical protein